MKFLLLKVWILNCPYDWDLEQYNLDKSLIEDKFTYGLTIFESNGDIGRMIPEYRITTNSA